MIEIKGSKEDLADVILGIAPNYPVDLIKHLTVGIWHFMINGINVYVEIAEEKAP